MAPRQGCCLASVGTQGLGPLLWPDSAGGSTPASSCCRYLARPACSSAGILPGEPPCPTLREVQQTHNLLGAWRTCWYQGAWLSPDARMARGGPSSHEGERSGPWSPKGGRSPGDRDISELSQPHKSFATQPSLGPSPKVASGSSLQSHLLTQVIRWFQKALSRGRAPYCPPPGRN